MAITATRPPRVGKWTEQALRVLRERYLTREGDRAQETPEEMCWRVAVAIAQGEERWGKSPAVVHEIACAFYDIMVDGKFLPNSPTLMNAGKGNQLQYSACYVLPVGDSMEEIFDAVKSAAIIHKSGGGTGFAFSRLRQKDAVVTSTGGKASGPVSFLRVFNGATEAVKQGGTRRGANMGILRIDHPDVLEFIECKLDGGIVNFNISVAATDRFMDALQKGEEYELIAPHNGEVVEPAARPRRVRPDRARRVADRRSRHGLPRPDQREPGEPDARDRDDRGHEPLRGAAAPAERGVQPRARINVAMFARRQADGEWAVDWTELERVVRLSVRFLDDVIEVNPYPLPEIDETVKANRRIGLGVMGWADLLFRMGIPYDSQPALDLGRPAHGVHQREGARPVGEARRGARAVPELAAVHLQARAAAPELDGHDHRPHRDDLDDRRAAPPASSRPSRWPSPTRWATACCPSRTRSSPRWPGSAASTPTRSWRRSPSAASSTGWPGVPEDVQRVFVTAHEVPFEWHVRHQGAFQKSHGQRRVQDHQPAQLGDASTTSPARTSWPGSWDASASRCSATAARRAVLHVGTKTGKRRQARRGRGGPAAGGRQAAARGASRAGRTASRRRSAPPTSSSTSTATASPSRSSSRWARPGPTRWRSPRRMGRLISLTLRMPSPLSTKRRLEEVVAQLSGIGGGRPLGFGPQRVLSLPDGIARVLAEHLGPGQGRGGRAAGGAARRSSWRGTSARSAGRRPSSTRKAARSATGAASTSAEPRSPERPPAGRHAPRSLAGARGGRGRSRLRHA